MKILISLVVSMGVGSFAFASSALDNAFSTYKSAKVSGQVRLGYINQDSDDKSTDANNMATGGYLKFETGELNGFSAGAAFYTTHRMSKNNAQDVATNLFNQTDGDGFSLLGEAYIKAHRNSTTLVLGRQMIDTPFADSDDIRMIPNLFEAYVLTNTDVEDTTLTAAYIKKWAGVDAPTQEVFEDLNAAGDGTIMLSAIYSGIENSEISAWYYNVDEMTDIVYLEGSTELSLNENLILALSAQYANFSEDGASLIDGNVYGLSADLRIESVGVNLMAAYNGSSSDNTKSVINGFGGGPYMTSMDEMTIDSLNDAKAYMVGISKEYKEFLFSLNYGNFQEDSTRLEVDEINLVAEYAYDDNLNFVFMYTDLEAKDITGKDDNAASFDRVQFYANYNF